MIKAFAKYLIIPCILLLGGYGQLAAHTEKENAASHSIYSADALTQNLPNLVEHLPTSSIHTATSGAEKGNRKGFISVFEFEEEKDERVSFKRYSNRNNYSITLYTPQAPHFNFQSIEKRSHSHGYAQFTSPAYPSHLLFQVFRI